MKVTCFVAAVLLVAQAAAVPMAAAQQSGLQMEIDSPMLTEGFLSAHPDIRWQREGRDQYFADELWKPEAYWRMQDRMWNAPDRDGHVDVGEPVRVPQEDNDR